MVEDIYCTDFPFLWCPPPTKRPRPLQIQHFCFQMTRNHPSHPHWRWEHPQEPEMQTKSLDGWMSHATFLADGFVWHFTPLKTQKWESELQFKHLKCFCRARFYHLKVLGLTRPTHKIFTTFRAVLKQSYFRQTDIFQWFIKTLSPNKWMNMKSTHAQHQFIKSKSLHNFHLLCPLFLHLP